MTFYLIRELPNLEFYKRMREEEEASFYLI